MNKVRRFLAVLITLALFSAAAVSAAETLTEITLGIIPTESSSGAMKGFEPFRADMEKALGIPVKLFIAPDYAGVIEAMRFNKVHIAWFGNKSAIEAVNRASGEVFVQTVDVTGNPGYWSLIVVHKDSPYQNIDEIIRDGKNLTFGNGDPNSTSGYLIPTYYVWGQRGIDPTKHFKLVRSANHETNLMAVANKQVDFATNNTENWDKFATGPPRPDQKRPRHLEKPPDPERPHGVAQGPAQGDEEQDQRLLPGLRPDRGGQGKGTRGAEEHELRLGALPGLLQPPVAADHGNQFRQGQDETREQ